jgi:hypothetical protein
VSKTAQGRNRHESPGKTLQPGTAYLDSPRPAAKCLRGEVKESSFSEEKEAKRLFAALRGRRSRPALSLAPAAQRLKSLLVLFFRKEPLSFFLSQANPTHHPQVKYTRIENPV